MGCCSSRNSSSEIQEIDISSQNLKQIPPHVFKTKTLLRLKMSKNYISMMPAETKKLERLQYLDASENGMSAFPRDLPVSIQTLILCKNRFFISPITPSIGLLNNLAILDLSSNQLEYPITVTCRSIPPEFSKLRSLVSLDLSHNLIAEFPEAIYSLVGLETLLLADNKIASIGEAFENLQALKTLDLGKNKIRVVSDSIGACFQLTTLKLGNNEFQEIPDSIGKLSSLEVFEVQENPNLLGLPITCTSLRQLKTLWIYGTLSDHFPFALESWAGMTELIIKLNPKIEEIPETISTLEGLRLLDVAECALTAIPDSIGNLKSLTRLDLKKNRIISTGIPESIGELQSLTYLSLSNNYLTQLREEFFDLRALTDLDLGHNSLIALPDEIQNLSNLVKLYLGFNKLEQLPATISNLKKLILLECRHNILSSLPASLSECPLIRLDVSDNHLADVPNSFAKFKSLEFLNLKGNNLEFELDQSASKGIPQLVKFLEKRQENQEYAKNKDKKLKAGSKERV